MTPTILIVEDDVLVAEFLVELIAEEGRFSAVFASTAAEALAIVDSRQVAVLVTDIVLPGAMNGFRLAEEVRKREPPIPVICVSGHPRRDGSSGSSSEADACSIYLQKPYQPADLIRAIDQVLGSARG